jgi:RNA polymerase sigma-70 factor, ECF subfamily
MSDQSLQGLSDRDLIALYRRSPGADVARDAVSELFTRYRDRLYVWCFRHMGNHESALDLAQETLLAAYQALPKFEGRSEFSSWLFSIARYRCISAIRLPRLTVDDGCDPDGFPGGEPDPERDLELRREEEMTLGFLNRVLDREERVALWMRCYEGASLEEITRMMDVAETDGVRVLLQRARRKLRAALPREWRRE